MVATAIAVSCILFGISVLLVFAALIMGFIWLDKRTSAFEDRQMQRELLDAAAKSPGATEDLLLTAAPVRRRQTARDASIVASGLRSAPPTTPPSPSDIDADIQQRVDRPTRTTRQDDNSHGHLGFGASESYSNQGVATNGVRT